MTKVIGDQPLPSANAGTVRMARNEFEGVQLAVRPTRPYPFTVTFDAPAHLTTKERLGTNVYREIYDFLPHASGPDGRSGWWPDKLIPVTDDLTGAAYIHSDGTKAFPFTPALIGGSLQNFVAYIEIYAPPTATPGRYYGTITLSWTETDGVTYHSDWLVAIDVEPFSLPYTSTLPTYYHMTSSKVCDAHQAPAGSTTCDSLRLSYARFTLDHRISAGPGLAPTDAAIVNYATYFAGQYAAPMPPATAPWLWKAQPRTTGAYTSTDLTLLPTWMDTYRSKGWLDRALLYWCDEPQGGRFCPGWPDKVRDAATIAHSGAVPLRQVVTTSHQTATQLNTSTTTYQQYIDVITPNIILVQPPGTSVFPAATLRLYQPYIDRSGGLSMWWYQANDTAAYGDPTQTAYQGYPQMGIDVPGAKNRAFQWMTFSMAPTRGGNSIGGELYWETLSAYTSGGTLAPDAVFTAYGQNGEGNLMYPGNNRPLPSLRLKLLRDGMEDYEYLELVKSLAGTDCARSIARTAFPNARAVDGAAGTRLLEQRTVAASMIKNPTQPCTLVLW